MSHDQPERPANLGWLLSTTAHALATELTAGLDAISVTPRAHCVLNAAMTGEYTQTALAQAVGLDKTTMVVTIDALERAGLVERRMSSTDRRARVIAVTDAGRRKVAEGERIVQDIQDDVLAALEPDVREAFVAGLRQLAEERLCSDCGHSVRRRAPRSAAAAA